MLTVNVQNNKMNVSVKNNKGNNYEFLRAEEVRQKSEKELISEKFSKTLRQTLQI